MIGKALKIINWLYEQDKEKIFEIKEHKKKRKLNQNDKYWKLINELSRKTKIGVSELHFDMLKNYSVRYEILVPRETLLRGIEYYEKKSTIKKGDKLFDVYHVYTPSHELKTDECAILLDGLCQACKEQGIEARSPEEIEKEESLYGKF
jgi:hypothetical protein